MAACCSSLQRLQLQDMSLQWAPLQATIAQLAGSLTDLDLDDSCFFHNLPPSGLLAFNTGYALKELLARCMRISMLTRFWLSCAIQLAAVLLESKFGVAVSVQAFSTWHSFLDDDDCPVTST